MMKNFIRSKEKVICRMTGAGLFAGMLLFGWIDFLGMDIQGVFADILEKNTLFFRNVFPKLAENEIASEIWRLGCELLLIGFLTGFCYLAEMLFEKHQICKAAVGILAFLTMAFCLFAERELNRYGVAFMTVFCVIVWMERIQGRMKKTRKERNSREAHTLWVMPFFILYLVILFAMPVPKNPYDWKWAKNIGEKIREIALACTQHIKWGNKEGFRLAFDGSSEEGELGAGVEETSDRLMKIRVEKNGFEDKAGSLYLTGKVYDTFGGRGWRQEWQGHEGEAFLDTAQTLYAVKNYSEAYQWDYLREASLEIRFEDFSTGWVFAPLKTWSVEGMERRDYESAGGSLRWKRKKGYGTEYKLRYFKMNAGQQEFDLFLEEAMENAKNQKGSEEILAEVLQECAGKSGQAITRDEMEIYRKEVKEQYLKEVKMPADVKQYMEEITADAKTDMEKLRATEAALRSFFYTKTPGRMPEWVKEDGDFLEYFLLESRQGYCTYFATAFVLLARAQGFPARYVEGYCVPVPSGGEAYVDSSMAHAWPEVYLDGAGWIPFEPTPGYAEKRYSMWELKQPLQGNLPKDQAGSWVSTQEPGSQQKYAGNLPEAENSPEKEDRADYFHFWKLLAMGIFVLLTVGSITLVIHTAVWRYRCKKMSPGEKFRMVVFRNLEILAWIGVKRNAGETLQELGERAETFPGLGEENAEVFQFLKEYEKTVYGKETVTAQMLESALWAEKRLLQVLKKEKGQWYFYWRDSLFGSWH